MTITANTTVDAISATALGKVSLTTETGSKIKLSGSQALKTWSTTYSDGQATYGRR